MSAIRPWSAACGGAAEMGWFEPHEEVTEHATGVDGHQEPGHDSLYLREREEGTLYGFCIVVPETKFDALAMP